jgi:predicted DNA-binding transcriptional regulator AlpA
MSQETWTYKDIAKEYGRKVETVREKWAKRPGFPKPEVNISSRTKRFIAAEVKAWAKGEKQ